MFLLNHETVKLSRKTGNALKWWMCFEKIGASPRFAKQTKQAAGFFWKSLFGMKRAGSMSICWWCLPSMEKQMWKYPVIPVRWWQESLMLTVVILFHLSELLLGNIPILYSHDPIVYQYLLVKSTISLWFHLIFHSMTRMFRAHKCHVEVGLRQASQAQEDRDHREAWSFSSLTKLLKMVNIWLIYGYYLVNDG